MSNVNVDNIQSLSQAMDERGRLEPGKMRPFVKDGATYITVHKGGDPMKAESYEDIQINNTGTLRRDEWKQLDEAVMGVSKIRLKGIADLQNKGLVYNLGNAMGTTVLERHKRSDAFEATMSMDAVTRSEADRVMYKTNYLPIPVIHVDYEINLRTLSASRNMGNALDTAQAQEAAWAVNNYLEQLLFTNKTLEFDGGNIYSYLSHPSKNTVTLSKRWDNDSKTGKQCVEDVMEMKQASIDNKHFGPWMLYVPTGYETKLDEDYDDTTPGTTVRERIEKISGIDGVKVIDNLPEHKILLVQMTPNVVRLVKGMDIQNVQWQTAGGFVEKFKVMTIQVPEVQADYNGNSGVTLMEE